MINSLSVLHSLEYPKRFTELSREERGEGGDRVKVINPKYSLETLMLKLQYFGHLMQRADSLAKTLMLGKIEGRRRG